MVFIVNSRKWNRKFMAKHKVRKRIFTQTFRGIHSLYLPSFCCWHLPVHFAHKILAQHTEVRVVLVHHHHQSGKKMRHWERNMNRAAECINISVNIRVRNSVFNTYMRAVASYEEQSILNSPIYLFPTFSILSGNAHHCSFSLFLKCVATEIVWKLFFVNNALSPCFSPSASSCFQTKLMTETLHQHIAISRSIWGAQIAQSIPKSSVPFFFPLVDFSICLFIFPSFFPSHTQPLFPSPGLHFLSLFTICRDYVNQIMK